MNGMLSCALSLQTALPLNATYRVAELDLSKQKALSAQLCVPPRSINTILKMRAVNIALSGIASLKDGWYGEESVAISEKVINRARLVAERGISAGLPAPELTPTTHGTVSLEWENDHAAGYIEVGTTLMNGFLRMAGNAPTLISDVAELPQTLYLDWSALLVPQAVKSVSAPKQSVTSTVIYTM